MKKVARIENLDCANCAAKLERVIAKIDGVKEVSINFMTTKMNLELADELAEQAIAEIKATATKIEPDWKIIGL